MAAREKPHDHHGDGDHVHDDERHKVTRFSASVDPTLLDEFDANIEKIGYNRSTAIVAAMRNFIVDRVWESEGGEVVGAITMIYDHHKSGVTGELTDIQHDYYHEITASTHVHIDHDNCLEIVAFRGETRRIKALSERLSTCRGVKQSKITTLKI
ncbi:TPA: nickel-responsive transcriptional regulator NikR [Candidatus Bathyarchaeota archaeon]|nr:nickel-responsive transcriptional regulator NikR [Candidatus Bathyarchaeota archaeon]